MHPGLFDDQPRVPSALGFGKKMAGSDHVTDIMSSQNMQGLAARFNDIKEEKYASNMREPLAKGFQRNYNWPQPVSENKENFAFGVPTISSDTTKELMNPDMP